MKINIIGAGISGLVAAKVLEENGLSSTIIEASNEIGGRVKTDIVDGFQLDHGFQVLLSEYPAAKKHLNYEELELQSFDSGACIFTNGKQKTIGDPLRDFSTLLPSLFSGIGNFGDKLKILKLNRQLQKKSITAIFESPEKTTKDYLFDFGFSNDIIKRFFVPFFTGIFLETELSTSSRMFEFVFKMFAEGTALLPKKGIKAIPDQLASKLKSSSFIFNTKALEIKGNNILLDNGEEINSDFTIIATDVDGLLPDNNSNKTKWKSCSNLYFTTNEKNYKKPLIGLVTNQDSLINNIFYHNSLATAQKGKGELLSVTLVKEHQLSKENLIKQVEKELKLVCGIQNLKFLKLYNIPKALPQLSDLKYSLEPKELQLSDSIFLAGDLHLNGSLNAAMLSGEAAAKGVIESIKNHQCLKQYT